MSVVEGHAEHVMDACAEHEPGLAELRAAVDERRGRRGGMADVIGRLLGIEVKLRQYRVGKQFWDTIVASRGEEALELVWSSPAALPDLGELEDPERWLERVLEPAGAHA